MTVSQLRDALIDDRPNVSRALNKMVEKGLVRRRLHRRADERITGHDLGLSAKDCRVLIDLLMKI